MTLLTVTEFREHVTTSLGDAAVQRLLDDAEAEIIAYAGDVSTATELMAGGTSRIVTSRPIDSVTTVVERDGGSSSVTLATDDWEMFGSFVLLRSRDGTNHSSYWRGPVRLTYVPVDDTATREIVQVELCKLAIAFNPGLAAETVGSWTQQYASNSAWNAGEERANILSRLRESPLMAVI